MKKLLGGGLGLALLYASTAPAHADILKNLQMDGELDLYSMGSQNLTDFNGATDDHDATAHARIMVNSSFDLNDDVSAVVSLTKTDWSFGSGTGTGAANTPGSQPVMAANSGVLGGIAVTQAYIKIKNMFGIDQMVGRQYYGDPQDLLVYYGPERYPYIQTLPVNAVDAWTGWWNSGDNTWKAHAIVGELVSGTNAGEPVGSGDQDINGIEGSWSQGDAFNAEGRVYDLQTRGMNTSGTVALVPGSDADFWAIEPKVSGKVMDGNLTYLGEAVFNAGSTMGVAQGNDTCIDNHGNCDAEGYGFLANASYSMPLMGTLKVSAEFGYGSGNSAGSTSGDDKSVQFVNSDYRPGDIWGGNGGVFASAYTAGIHTYIPLGGAGLTDLETFNVGFWHSPDALPKLGWGLHFYNFNTTATSGTGSNALGNELDLDAKWQQSDKLALTAGIGQFYPGSMIKDDTGNDSDVTQYFLDFHVMF